MLTFFCLVWMLLVSITESTYQVKKTDICPNGRNGTCGTMRGLVCPAESTCLFTRKYLGASGHCCINKHVKVCLQPVEPGPCRAAITRYFYNAKSCTCEPFSWGGCAPNDNNFETLEYCEASCEDKLKNYPFCKLAIDKGECMKPSTRWFFNSETCQCEQYTGCEVNGNSFGTKEKCEFRCGCSDCKNVCNMPIKMSNDDGPLCGGYIPSYGYNTKTCKCERFIYSGCGGNANRFDTLKACNKRCEKNECNVKPLYSCMLARDQSNFGATQNRYFYDSKICKCRIARRGECKGRKTFPTLKLCEKSCQDMTCPSTVCNLSKNKGTCKKNIKRFFFNKHTCKCEQFVYGGCGGNENRYDTREECEAICGNIECPVCNLPPKKGTGNRGNKKQEKWYYDAAECQCKTFTYKGRSGNLNRFDTEKECKKFCGSAPCPICSLPKETGSCNKNIPRFFYNPNTKRCEKFAWKGCGLNLNNFDSKKHCKKVCGRKNSSKNFINTIFQQTKQ